MVVYSDGKSTGSECNSNIIVLFRFGFGYIGSKCPFRVSE